MGSWKCLLDLAHVTADRTCQDGSPGFSGLEEEEDVLQSRASLLHHQRDRGDRSLLKGLLQGCQAGCACRGAPGFEQGPCAPGCCVPGQGLCCLPESALSLPGELPMALQGEALGGRSDPRQSRAGSFCSQEGASWVRAAHSSRSVLGHFPGDVSRGRCRQELPGKEGASLRFQFHAVGL